MFSMYDFPFKEVGGAHLQNEAFRIFWITPRYSEYDFPQNGRQIYTKNSVFLNCLDMAIQMDV